MRVSFSSLLLLATSSAIFVNMVGATPVRNHPMRSVKRDQVQDSNDPDFDDSIILPVLEDTGDIAEDLESISTALRDMWFQLGIVQAGTAGLGISGSTNGNSSTALSKRQIQTSASFPNRPSTAVIVTSVAEAIQFIQQDKDTIIGNVNSIIDTLPALQQDLVNLGFAPNNSLI